MIFAVITCCIFIERFLWWAPSFRHCRATDLCTVNLEGLLECSQCGKTSFHQHMLLERETNPVHSYCLCGSHSWALPLRASVSFKRRFGVGICLISVSEADRTGSMKPSRVAAPLRPLALRRWHRVNRNVTHFQVTLLFSNFSRNTGLTVFDHFQGSLVHEQNSYNTITETSCVLKRHVFPS